MGTKENLKTAWSELLGGERSVEDGPRSTGVERTPEKNDSETKFQKVSVIGKDVVIEGNITAGKDIQIDGKVLGNIHCSGRIFCTGQVEGDITCGDIAMKGGQVKGSIRAHGFVRVDENTLIIGNIHANELENSGRIRGDVRTDGIIKINERATLMGNLSGKGISLAPGAALKASFYMESGSVSEDCFKISERKTFAAEAETAGAAEPVDEAIPKEK